MKLDFRQIPSHLGLFIQIRQNLPYLRGCHFLPPLPALIHEQVMTVPRGASLPPPPPCTNPQVSDDGTSGGVTTVPRGDVKRTRKTIANIVVERQYIHLGKNGREGSVHQNRVQEMHQAGTGSSCFKARAEGAYGYSRGSEKRHYCLGFCAGCHWTGIEVFNGVPPSVWEWGIGSPLLTRETSSASQGGTEAGRTPCGGK